jgi:hypothetical protein
VEVQVFLAGWEIECCQPPPGEGDRVAWPLRWADDPTGPGAVELDWHAAEAVPGGVLLARGPLRAWWRGTGAVPARGSLWADLHGGCEEVLPTRGTVLSVRVVEQAYRYTGRRYEPLDGAYTLRPVDRSPTWFSGRPRDEDPPAEILRQESGVLVGLRVDAAPDMLPG